jgi:hypothetical protein
MNFGARALGASPYLQHFCTPLTQKTWKLLNPLPKMLISFCDHRLYVYELRYTSSRVFPAYTKLSLPLEHKKKTWTLLNVSPQNDNFLKLE